ncbi:MAG: hypothetical protein AAGU21_02270 [Solidesulfovibrio sp.]|uniref:hypothetical protein n=1 Tax=Solidesulfovibrio sp. TaxID=2910990 RepID=UPI003158B4E4
MKLQKETPQGLAPEGGQEAWIDDFFKLNNGHPHISQGVFAWLWVNADRFIPLDAKHYCFKIERKVATWYSVVYSKHRIAVDAAANHAHFFSIHGFEDEPLPTSDPRNLDIVRYGHWHLDFDADQSDITPALIDLRKLLFRILPDYGVDPKVVPIYYSGGKGFHATIFNTLLGTEAGSNILWSIYGEMAKELKKELPTLDTGIYKSGKGQLYRIPNVKREEKNCIHKIPLLLSEVAEQGGLSIPEIVELAKQPRLIALPAVPKSEVKQ